MSDFPINPNPEFQETMRQLQPDDPAHADMFNQMFQTLLDNDAFLNVLAERMIEKNAIANNLTTNDTNMVLSAAMGKTLADQVKDTITSDTKDNITTFLQSGTRSNIISGENHSFMLGKISKWFADLKGMAFKDKVAAGDLESSLKSYIDSKFAAENIVQNAEIADEAKVASSAVTHDLQQQITEQNNNLLSGANILYYSEIKGGDADEIRTPLKLFVMDFLHTPFPHGFLECHYFNGSGFNISPSGISYQVFKTFNNSDVYYRHCVGVNGVWSEWVRHVTNEDIVKCFSTKTWTGNIDPKEYYDSGAYWYEPDLNGGKRNIILSFNFERPETRLLGGLQIAFSTVPYGRISWRYITNNAAWQWTLLHE